MKKKEVLKSIIVEFHSWNLPSVIERNIKLPVDSNKIVSVIGSRRAGKTYLLFRTISELISDGIDKRRCVYINFEDERMDLTKEDLNLLLQAYSELYPDIDLKDIYLFFDEIQNVNGWERFVRRVYETITKNIFITGSNSKLLGDEIATSLRGRTLTYEVSPLTFEEFLRFKDFKFDFNVDIYDTNKKAKLIKLFNEFLVYGGFPEIPLMRKELKLLALQEYFNVMIYRDIVERYSIKEPFVLKYFIKRVAENITSSFSTNKIYNELKSQGIKVSKNTLYNYLYYMETSFLIGLVKKHHHSVLKSELSEKKVYFVDNGLLNAIRSFGETSRGALLENLIWHELKTKYNSIKFFKGKRECDFVVDERMAIQVCYEFSSEATRKREIEGLIECCKYFNLKEGFIVTFDDEEEIVEEGVRIKVIPAYRFVVTDI
ncbi:ATP-binding protein [Hippea alviniae]|uniref:ATP-binding protein n=1 Tax=Hippea alviniae TaxID=1279027 RepID=UPI0003B66779|nr:ATP-binding protein [Hippea alviniae]